MFGLIGDTFLDSQLFIKHNCIVICFQNFQCYLRKLTTNIKGIKHGHIRWLVLRGIGYKITKHPNGFELKLGFNHLIQISLIKSTSKFTLINNKLKIWGSCLEQVSLTAKNIKILKKINIYKGNGIIYRDQKIKLKIGKK